MATVKKLILFFTFFIKQNRETNEFYIPIRDHDIYVLFMKIAPIALGTWQQNMKNWKFVGDFDLL